jgi:hypothetical protein
MFNCDMECRTYASSDIACASSSVSTATWMQAAFECIKQWKSCDHMPQFKPNFNSEMFQTRFQVLEAAEFREHRAQAAFLAVQAQF